MEYQRDVVPIFFGGRNSDRFYRIARFSDKYVKKVNIAMLFLVDEMYRNVGKTFRVVIGKPIPWQTFDKSRTSMEWAKYVEDMVYELYILALLNDRIKSSIKRLDLEKEKDR